MNRFLPALVGVPVMATLGFLLGAPAADVVVDLTFWLSGYVCAWQACR